MTDLLHIPSARLVVWYKGEEALMLNKALLDQQLCWENLERLKDLHVRRLEIEDAMEDRSYVTTNIWTEIQFQLQDAWKFPRDSRYHRFWDIPSCTCPKLDNDDRYPSDLYIIDMSCRLHGNGEKE